MKKAEELEKIIDCSSKVTIVVHIHPDGDAVGSGCAMLRFLRLCKGKEAALLVPTPVPQSLDFIVSEDDRILTYTSEPELCLEWIRQSDLIICQDCNSFSRTGGLEPFLTDSGASKVLIDHHLNPESGAFSLTISKTKISSACEMLYRILKEMGSIAGRTEKLPVSSLEALMAGMTTDTNNFANSVFPGTLQMASELLDAGVDRDRILSCLYNNYKESRFRLMGHMLHERMKIMHNGVAFMILDKELQEEYAFEDGLAEGFVNIPLGIGKVIASMMLTQEEEKFRVSIRSKKGVSANLFAMKYFNGGGHEQAAGGSLYIGKDIPDAGAAEEYIIRVSEEFFGK